MSLRCHVEFTSISLQFHFGVTWSSLWVSKVTLCGRRPGLRDLGGNMEKRTQQVKTGRKAGPGLGQKDKL
jgi:hypothetical protein